MRIEVQTGPRNSGFPEIKQCFLGLEACYFPQSVHLAGGNNEKIQSFPHKCFRYSYGLR